MRKQTKGRKTQIIPIVKYLDKKGNEVSKKSSKVATIIETNKTKTITHR